MILQSLVGLYEVLTSKGAIAKPGRSQVRIQYGLELNRDGQLRAVLPLETLSEKGKTIPRMFDMPAPVKRTVGIAPNFLWDNSAYILGIDQKDKPERARNCFLAAKKLHLSLLGEEEDPFAKAICAFFQNWVPENSGQVPALAEKLKDVTLGGNLTFLFENQFPDKYGLFDHIWQKHSMGNKINDGEMMRCLVTGERTVPEKIHPSIKRVYGAQPSGAALVSFNAPAFCSYNREQNWNAPVSQYAAFAYTTVLNHLLSDNTHCRRFGDTTMVYWAEDAQEQYQDIFSCMLDGNNTLTQDDLRAVVKSLAEGRNCNWDALPVKPDNHFCVLGVAPNAARLSVRFFLQDDFGSFARNFQQHFERLRIVRPFFDKDDNLPLWRLMRETTNQNSKDKAASPQMAGDTLRAILTNGRYPATLYQQTLLRIKAEHEVTRGRAAIIKAYLLKNGRLSRYEEALTVELNKDCTYLPYILGRLFAVLERIQLHVNPDINVTIKDKYFTSACATPSVVFPTLLKLAEKHLRKMNEKDASYDRLQLVSLMKKINQEFPKHLNMDDQGIFEIGYYHETQACYGNRTKTAIAKEEKENV